MRIKDLVVSLLRFNPEAQVFFMTTRKSPFENAIAGIVQRSEMLDQLGRDEYGVEADDVFLTVGRRIRPGSLSAWIIPERLAGAGIATAQEGAQVDRDEAIRSIADEYLHIDDLSADEDIAGPAIAPVDDVRRALDAAYHAGIASVLRRREPGDETEALRLSQAAPDARAEPNARAAPDASTESDEEQAAEHVE
jgi:hypothetical protein